MKERLQQLLSEAGESIDYIRSDIRNLSRYMAELEELVEVYRAFALNATLTTQTDRVKRRKLLKRTQKVVGSLKDAQPEEDAHNKASKTKDRTEPRLPGGNSNSKRAKSASLFRDLSVQPLWQTPPK
jgi:hypothetical protein